jgi:hypothetical protein
MRKVLALAALVLLVATPAAAWRNVPVEILDDVTVSNGAPNSVTFSNPTASSMLLIYTTADEVATASLVVQVAITTAIGDIVICTGNAVTTETTTTMLVGSRAAAAGSIDLACDYPMAANMKVTFTVTGGGASFDISASAELLLNTAP